MKPEELEEAIRTGDKWVVGLSLIYRLGGWAVLAIVCSIILKYVWDERTMANQALLDELRTGRKQTMEVLMQNSQALHASSESQERVAEAVKALTEEVRRQR